MDIVTVVVVLVLLVVGAAVAFAVALARRSKAQLAANVEVLPGMPTGAPPEWAGRAHTRGEDAPTSGELGADVGGDAAR